MTYKTGIDCLFSFLPSRSAHWLLLILQHAVAFVNGDQYYGAKASINVWAPRVADRYEFSLSQIWVISGSFGNDLNTIEAGWQASREKSHPCFPFTLFRWKTCVVMITEFVRSGQSRIIWRQQPTVLHLLDRKCKFFYIHHQNVLPFLG